jgi:uncharacterized membrane protein
MQKSRKLRFILCALLLVVLTAVQAVSAITVLADIQPTEKLDLNCKFPVLTSEGTVSFTYEIEVLYSGDGPKKTFDLNAKVPSEFTYSFQSSSYGSSNIKAIQLDPIRAYPETVKLTVQSLRLLLEPGEYPITMEVSSGTLKQSINLKAIINSKSVVDLTTPSERLNADATAGSESSFPITVKNTGTSPLVNVTLSSAGTKHPTGWTVKFNPEKIDKLDVNTDKEVIVTVKAPEKTIAGDYIVSIDAQPESKATQKTMDIRVTVLTPTIWGWLGVGIVVLVVIGLIFMFWKLGRR